jgi:hypothetical protein
VAVLGRRTAHRALLPSLLSFAAGALLDAALLGLLRDQLAPLGAGVLLTWAAGRLAF